MGKPHCPNCDSTDVGWTQGHASCSECGWEGDPYDMIDWGDDEEDEE